MCVEGKTEGRSPVTAILNEKEVEIAKLKSELQKVVSKGQEVPVVSMRKWCKD